MGILPQPGEEQIKSHGFIGNRAVTVPGGEFKATCIREREQPTTLRGRGGAVLQREKFPPKDLYVRGINTRKVTLKGPEWTTGKIGSAHCLTRNRLLKLGKVDLGNLGKGRYPKSCVHRKLNQRNDVVVLKGR